ncbi:MAG: response regulator [Candidatus Pacebacteria bacterium]|nr:response regulator [Candidatus Paceibacterota bacterium]
MAAKKILFIEDERRLHELMSPVLRKAGYEVFDAYDGELGLEIFKEQKPDLVILDLILPKKDGFEILEKIREDKELKDTSVAILTNLEEKFDIERAMAYGARAYLVKANYGPEEILKKVNEILN